MKFVLFLGSLLIAVILFGWFFFSLIRKKNIRATRFVSAVFSENQGVGIPLALTFYLWTLFFIASSGMLLFVAIMCAFYSFALFHGEFYLLLESISLTAGNVAVHIIYPIEIFVFSIMILVLFVGSFQVFFGPLHPLSKLALKVEGIGDLCGKIVALLGVVLMLELTKTAVYSLLVRPEMLHRFFAGESEPLLGIGAMSSMVGASLVLSGIVFFILSRNAGEESDGRNEND